MAERKLEVRILGDSRDLERAFGRSTTAARKFDRSMSGMGRAAAGLSKAFAVAAAGVTAIAVIGAREMSEQAKVSAQTATVLRNVAKQSGITTKQVEGLAGALQSATGAQDDQIQSASNVILRFGLITKTGKAAEGQLRTLTTTALDLSVATGRDVTASAQALGRALSDPTKAAGALRRAGIMLTASQRDQIKAMVEGGNVAGAQARVLDLVQSRVKGSAVAFGNTLPGQVQRAQRALEDLSENTLAALAPALAKIVPVMVKAIQGIAPVVARVGTIVADLVNDIITNPAFQEFAATLRDIAVRGVQFLASALKTIAPILIAILAPIASLAAAITRSGVAMKILTAAVVAFVATRAVAYVTALTSTIRGLAITQTAATGMRALTTAASALAFGFQGVSARAVGLAPGLTAAAGGVTRMGVAANAAKGILPGLGRNIAAAFGGPVGIAVAAGATLATVIGGDLVSSFRNASGPAQKYADAMQAAADGTTAAKDSLEGLADALLNGADAQDRTRDATANRVRAEKELRGLEAQGITSGPQYAAAVRTVRDARREEARATLSSRDATDATNQKMRETRDEYLKAIPAFAGVRQGLQQNASGMVLHALSSDEAKRRYAAFADVADRKLMGTQNLREFQSNATALASVFRNTGTPAAEAIARALDNVGKARTPAGVAKWAGEVVRLTGGSKADVERMKNSMNANFRATGKVRPSTTFFDGIMAQLSGVIALANTAIGKMDEIARKAAGGIKSLFERQAPASASAALSGTPNLMSWFYSQRSAAAGAASGLSSLAREGFIANSDIAKGVKERRAARATELEGMTRAEFETRIAAAETADEKRRIELDFAEWEDSLRMDKVEKDADAHAQSIDDLSSEFARGKISAEQFRDDLNKIIGGATGESYGKALGERWLAAFEAVVGTGSPLQAIIDRGLGTYGSAQPVDEPQAEAAPDVPETSTAAPKNAKGLTYDQWRKRRGDFLRAYNAAIKNGYTAAEKAAMRRQWKATTPDEYIRNVIGSQPPRAALGGITRGLTIAGEAGREAIIPLTGARGVAYMSRVMEQAGRRSGAMVVVNVRGNEFSAEEFARRIGPELRRQIALTGSY